MLDCFFLITSLSSVLAVGSDFEKSYGGPNLDRGIHVTPTKDNGFIAVGLTQHPRRGDEDVLVVKVDSKGEEAWTKTFGGPREDNGWVVIEHEDGYLIAGSTSSFGNGGSDFYLVKLDGRGNVESSNTFGGKGDERCWGMIRTNDEGFLLVGETTSYGSGQEDFYLVKVDKNGEQQWTQSIGGEMGDRCFSAAQTADGGFVLAGQTYSEGAGDRDAYVVKVDSKGQVEWKKTFGGAGSDVAHCVTRTREGRYLVTGYTASPSEPNESPFLNVVDAFGNEIWTRTLNLDRSTRTLTADMSSDGGFYLTGYASNSEKRSQTAILIKTNQIGEVQWVKDYLPKGNRLSFGYTVKATGNDGCILTGHAGEHEGNLDLLIVSFQESGF